MTSNQFPIPFAPAASPHTYAALAREHWRTHLPSRYASLTDPDAFFADLGAQAAVQVIEVWDQLRTAAAMPTDEPYLDRVGRLNSLKRQAEELVLTDLVLLAAEDADEVQQESADWGWIEATLDALVDERITPADLSPRQVGVLRQYLPAKALELAGIPEPPAAG
jgi:hypothetical protein